MTTIKGVFDGKSIQLLEPIELDKPHWVNVIIGEAVENGQADSQQRQRILSYAGILSDLTETEWETLLGSIKRRSYFLERDLSW
jgi:hypothetical protein